MNRLTDYVDADQFTHQSLIKRTPVQLQGLRPLEMALWKAPEKDVLISAIETVFANWRAAFPSDDEWIATQRDNPDALTWLPPEQLRNPADDYSQLLSEAVGALTVFFQQYMADVHYKKQAGALLYSLRTEVRDKFLRVFLPLLRRLDYQSVLHPLLADFVGSVTVMDSNGDTDELDLLSAHKSAVLEFKEEIVAIQLFIAVKRGLDVLYGPGTQVCRDDLAFVSGVAIPCAGDVPAHFLGISPAQLNSALLVHSRAIGNSALIIVDRKRNRAVRVDVVTGVLPKDKELGHLRGIVINHKRAASGREHRRFFDRLGELIVDYVRTGDENFSITGPVPLDWKEYRSKLAFSPANGRGFVNYLVSQGISSDLADGLIGLGVLDSTRDADALQAIRAKSCPASVEAEVFDPEQLYAGTLTERVNRVVQTIIEPVLANDGGRLDILRLDEAKGELQIRFVGSCANCPYSLLSMEQIVKPSLQAIPGIENVVHRAKARNKELEQQQRSYRPESPIKWHPNPHSTIILSDFEKV